MNLRCTACGRAYPLPTQDWRCECGGVFELEGTPPFSRQAVRSDEATLWRYRAMLPIEHEEHIVSLGEGFTPLVEANAYGLPVLCKLEFLAPTGSFKDRGTTVLVSALREMGVTRVVEDSSGNAAASLAAYCARAGIRARIFVPAHASPAKLAQIAIYDAELVPVEGPRERAAEAAQDAARRAYYASHYYNPFPLEGLKTFAYEVWEQLGGRAPHNIVFPVGHGTFLLGTHRGFGELRTAGLIERMPRLFAVQARACAPLYQAYRQGLETPPLTSEGETIAEGIRIAHPVRGEQVLRAVRETGGAILAVDDGEIQWARDHLIRQGLYVEPTSAVALAGLRKLDKAIAPDEITIVPLTGSGLKSP
ncbi:MAG TPA: pyridoxal-phosphate dependent enzyme [Anaerolineae bacterium]|nr:pyridoxal-phosphate dependent enzyme [Anaerolineae bacterium]